MSDYGISPVPRMMSDSRKGLTGLQNLGNTCFMNAAMQCMSNTYELTQFMTSNKFLDDLNPKNPLGTSKQSFDLFDSFRRLFGNLVCGIDENDVVWQAVIALCLGTQKSDRQIRSLILWVWTVRFARAFVLLVGWAA